MKIQIRKATINDLEAIRNLNLKLFKNEYRFDKTLDLRWPKTSMGTRYFKSRILKNDSFVFIAIVKEKVTGYLIGALEPVWSYRKKMRMAEIHNMYVEREFQGKGVGTKLVNEFLTWCKKTKVERVKVDASPANKRAIEFYSKNGFLEYQITLEKEL